MFGNSVIVLVIFFSGNVFSLPVNKTSSRVCPFEFVNRTEWGARPATGITSLNTPVPVVVIHHTYLPEACWNKLECGRAMRSMQQTHQQTNGWADIGYNFAVGSDGVVYEGRGWEAVGAHTVGQNVRSIGIVLIGSWIDKEPPSKQIEVAQDLIATGVKLGFIQQNYQLRGHRQLSFSTECPGSALYENLKTWHNFSENDVL